MKYGQVETEKMYFTSNDASKIVGVPISVLRLWEKEFSALNPKKNRAGKRMYSHSDIEIAKKIKIDSNYEPPKELRKKTTKPKAVNSKLVMDKKSLLKIRSNLQSVLNKIKK